GATPCDDRLPHHHPEIRNGHRFHRFLSAQYGHAGHFSPDRVVDAFFVWASDDPRTYHDSLHVMGRHEVKRLAADILVGRKRSFGEPRAKSRLTDRVAPEAPS